MQIQDRVFVVTGASSGIGLATAKALSALGAKLAILARSADTLQAISAELPHSLPVAADMTDFPGVRTAISDVQAHFGRIDGLVNNAGRSYAAAVEEIEPELFDEIFHLNVLGPIVAMQAVIPFMRAQGGGCIVNVNSASKRALLGFSLTARAELAKDDIVVGEVYPAVTATNFGVNRMVAPSGRGPAADYSKGDTAEFVADIIVQAIVEGGGQYFANDFLRKLAGA